MFQVFSETEPPAGKRRPSPVLGSAPGSAPGLFWSQTHSRGSRRSGTLGLGRETRTIQRVLLPGDKPIKLWQCRGCRWQRNEPTSPKPLGLGWHRSKRLLVLASTLGFVSFCNRADLTDQVHALRNYLSIPVSFQLFCEWLTCHQLNGRSWLVKLFYFFIETALKM